MAIVLKEPAALAKAIGSIAGFISEGNFRFSMDGLYFKGTDPSQILLVDYAIPKKVFAAYDVEPSFVGLDLVEMGKILARLNAGDELAMELESNELVLRLEGEYVRRFQLPLLDLHEEDVRLPQVEYETTIEVNGKTLKDILKDASLFGASVTLTAKSGQLTIESKNTQGQLKTTLKNNKLCAIAMSKEGKETTVKFSLNYLQNLVKEADADKKITLELKTDQPMRVSYPLGATKMQCYLAHMIL